MLVNIQKNVLRVLNQRFLLVSLILDQRLRHSTWTVMTLQDGYDTQIGERGIKLSGG